MTADVPNEKRCKRCGWPIVPEGEAGCWESNCSMRPIPPERKQEAEQLRPAWSEQGHAAACADMAAQIEAARIGGGDELLAANVCISSLCIAYKNADMSPSEIPVDDAYWIEVVRHGLSNTPGSWGVEMRADIVWDQWLKPAFEKHVLKRQSGGRTQLKDLVEIIRMKLERRFQVSDYFIDDVTGTRDLGQSPRIIASEICEDIMAHVREIHALAERALKEIGGGRDSLDSDPEIARIVGIIDRFWQLHSIEPATGFTPEQLAKEILK